MDERKGNTRTRGQAARGRRMNESNLSAIVETIPHVNVVIDNDGLIRLVRGDLVTHAGARPGRKLSDVLRSHSVRVLHDGREPDNGLAHERALGGEVARAQLLYLRSRTGTSGVILAMGACPVRDALGRIVGAALRTESITLVRS